MPFSRTPMMDTYSSQRLPVAWDLDFLEGNHSFSTMYAGMTNLVPYYLDETKVEYVESRSGLSTVPVVSGTGYTVRGGYVWEKFAGVPYYFVVISDGTNTYVYSSADSVTWTVVNSWADATRTPVRFCEFISGTNIKSLVMMTGVFGYVFTSNAAGTQIVDVDFPTPHIPFPVFLNGRVYIAKTNTGDIYNSALDDPSSWTAGDFISSEVYPDDIQALLKINNYILAIGLSGSEFFYDAANASASPLARYEGGTLPFGTQFPNSIASNRDSAMLLANRADGGESIFITIEGMSFKQVPAESLLKAFGAQLSQAMITAPGVRGTYVRQDGDLLYYLNFAADKHDTVPSHATVAYSVSTKKWVRWTFNVTEPLPVIVAHQGTSAFPFTIVFGHRGNTGVFFGVMTPEASIDSINSLTYNIYQEILIPPNNFGTLNRKFMSRLGIFYDRYNEAGAISVQYSDNGMLTFSTARTMAGNTQTSDGGFPFITQLGSFRNRGFKISTSGSKGRFYYVEVDINKGQQ